MTYLIVFLVVLALGVSFGLGIDLEHARMMDLWNKSEEERKP